LATINVSLPSDGESIDAADYGTPVTTIVNEINGGLDNANIKSAAAIAGSKLADASIDIGSKASVWDGWIAVSDSWSYASATTITVPSDATTKYSVGDKIKLVQSAATKYFYVTAVSSTVLTVTGGSDYTVANSAISGIYYSKTETPQGFPQWFNWSPTWTNFTVGSASQTAKFTMHGKKVFGHIDVVLSSSTMGSGPYFTLPVTSVSYAGTTTTQPIGLGRLFDAAPATALAGVFWKSTTTAEIQIWNAASTYVNTTGIASTVPWTWANSDEFHLEFTYEAA
jgi:hypothetical protein